MVRVRFTTAALLAAITLSTPLQAADGDLDHSFSGDGLDIQDWGSNFSHARAVAALPDGSVLVGGQVRGVGLDFNFGVVRYLASGALDADFAEAGRALVNFDIGGANRDSLNSILPLPDGRTMLIGSAETATTFLPALARLEADGDLDPTFGVGGKLVLDLLPDASLNVSVAMAVRHTDGKTVLVAATYPDATPSAWQALVIRLDEDGDPDPTFSTDGWTLLDIPDAVYDSPEAVRVDDLGRIHFVLNASGGAGYRPYYARLAATGPVEILEVIDFGEVWVAEDLALDPVAGTPILALRDSSADLDAGMVVRLEPDGDLDPTFGNAGFVDLTLEEGSLMRSISLQSDRKIVLAGDIDHTGTQERGFFLARLLSDGAFDPSFDGNGVVRYEFDVLVDGADGASALALSGGRLVAAGFTTIGPPDDRAFAVLRTQSALVFTDGFERGSASGWLGN